ncbi:MAG: DUF6390 family protein [Patescibacteria group bacterium]|jgi:hypothetical protein
MVLTLDYPQKIMDGILRCSRYAFGPNRLHYCGPDANSELLAYIKEGATDPGLEKILSAFNTLYPYLELIAHASGIKDPFDERVVEAYWIGNELLDKVERQALYRNLVEEHELKKKNGLKSFSKLENKIRLHAVPHHSFHVFNVWKGTGNMSTEYNLESLDSCRISWGKVLEVSGPTITVESEPLIQIGDKYILGKAEKKKLTRKLESTEEIEQLKIGDILTFHWSVPCEVISEKQASILKKYTLQNIGFLNQGI